MKQILEIENITKTFGGLTAVKDLSFGLDQGIIMGLIGPNGAGKTTVFNMITGNYRPDKGSIFFQGTNIVGRPTNQIVSKGIARTFQTIRLFQTMTVLENVLSGCHCRMKSGIISGMLRTPKQRREERWALDQALLHLDFVGLADQHDQLASNLSYGNQRLLEIARAMASGPKLLILDEPAGGMNAQETDKLLFLIKKLVETGMTILLIEHDMGLVMRACDRIVVIEYGSRIAQGTPGEIRENPRVIEAYLGSDEEDVPCSWK